MYKDYHYIGPIKKFNKTVKSRWEGNTKAESFPEAVRNLTSQAKKYIGLVQGTDVTIDRDGVFCVTDFYKEYDNKKKERDEELARRYESDYCIYDEDDEAIYQLEYCYNIYYDGNDRTYEEEIKDVTKLAKAYDCKVVKWEKLTGKGSENICVTFEGTKDNLKELLIQFGEDEKEFEDYMSQNLISKITDSKEPVWTKGDFKAYARFKDDIDVFYKNIIIFTCDDLEYAKRVVNRYLKNMDKFKEEFGIKDSKFIDAKERAWVNGDFKVCGNPSKNYFVVFYKDKRLFTCDDLEYAKRAVNYYSRDIKKFKRDFGIDDSKFRDEDPRVRELKYIIKRLESTDLTNAQRDALEEKRDLLREKLDNAGVVYTMDDSQFNDVKPNKGELKQDFIARFMRETKDEYPEFKQRLAVAYSYWDKYKKGK